MIERIQLAHLPTPIEHLSNLTRILKGPDTVSYTHLRAHETVLAIECRLLLEKKKPITDPTLRITLTPETE